MDDSLLLPAEVAEMLRVSVHTLASWRRTDSASELPWIEVGGQVRYRAQDVRAWLDKRTLGGVLPA